MSALSDRYRILEVAVSGGDLRVGVWEPISSEEDDPASTDAASTVLLIHGVTASHLSWQLVAERLPRARVIAPDLRGRGRSADLAGPAGMAAHADDLLAVLDALHAEKVVVAGHSMGAFVALVLGERHPERVSRLVLVDGGLPLDLPEDMPIDEVIRLVLGPTAERLSRRFASEQDYLDFWRAHPAFARDWSPALEAYLAYDLVGEAPELRPSTSYATLEEDSLDQNAGRDIAAAQSRPRHPVVLLSAERGLLDQVPALYAAERLPQKVAAVAGLRHLPVADVNHYTIVLSDRGADAVAETVRAEISADRRAPDGAAESVSGGRRPPAS